MQICKGKIQVSFKAVGFKALGDGDFEDVVIEGYASTGDSDRYGEHFISGAWSKAIDKYLNTNPVLLLNHSNDIHSVAGKIVELREEENAKLYMKAILSNAPDMKNIRIKAKEGIIRSVSVGGMWNYNGEQIKEVTDLYEISLVAIPANPHALITAKSYLDDKIDSINKLGNENRDITKKFVRITKDASGNTSKRFYFFR